MKERIACVKCEGEMVLGFIVDFTYGSKLQSRWVEGKPEESFWSGIKLDEHPQFLVTSYRCNKCGYLEFYASDRTY